jgi:hypothetical protein
MVDGVLIEVLALKDWAITQLRLSKQTLGAVESSEVPDEADRQR